jgi:hypothetical protein
MFKLKRINITLNTRQISDAQVFAALESLGGESASVLKALAMLPSPTPAAQISQESISKVEKTNITAPRNDYPRSASDLFNG